MPYKNRSIAHGPCGAEVTAAESEGGCFAANASAASTVTSGATEGTANERFRTLGTVLAAAATLTM